MDTPNFKPGDIVTPAARFGIKILAWRYQTETRARVVYTCGHLVCLQWIRSGWRGELACQVARRVKNSKTRDGLHPAWLFEKIA